MDRFICNNSLWRIFYVKPNDRNLRNKDGFSLGVCDNNTKCIYISNNLTRDKSTKVLTHEICHSFCFEYGIKLSYNSEEVLCNFVAEYGFEIIDIVEGIKRGLGVVA